MNSKKIKLITLLFGMLLLMICAGCNKKKNSKEVKYNAPENMYEALQRFSEYKTGTFSCTATVNIKNDNKNINMSAAINGKRADKNNMADFELSVSDGTDSIEIKTAELIVNYKDKTYINFDELVKGFAGEGYSLGTVKVSRPEINAAEDKEHIVASLLIEGFGNCSAGEDGHFTSRIDEAKELEIFLKNIISYLDKNRENINEYVKQNIDGFDYIGYLEKLVDENGDALSGVSGYQDILSKEQLQAMIKTLSYMRIEGSKVDVFSDFDELRDTVNKLTPDEYKAYVEKNRPVIEFTAVADENYYSVKLFLSSVDEKGNTCSAEFEYSFANDSGVTIQEPSDDIRLEKLVEKFNSYDKLSDKLNEGVKQFLSKYKSIISDIEPGFLPAGKNPGEGEQKTCSLKGSKTVLEMNYDSDFLSPSDEVKPSDNTVIFKAEGVAYVLVQYMDELSYKDYAISLKENEKTYNYRVTDYNDGTRTGLKYSVEISGVKGETVVLNLEDKILCISCCITSEELTTEDVVKAAVISTKLGKK
ncbi:MAG: hypothetical protein PUB67_03670 [Clostridiales bacterium]|nr:hypothetical protein [Clostridiales bacterium]